MNLLRIYKIRFFFIHYILMLIFALINVFFTDPNKSIKWDIPVYIDILLSSIIVPILETIIFQFVPKLVLDFVRIKNYYLVLFIMTIYFSASHPVHSYQNNVTLSILFTLVTGMIVNYYLQVQKREGTRQAMIKTIILHGTFNLTVGIINLIM